MGSKQRLNEFGLPIGEELANWSPPSPVAIDLLQGEYVRLERLQPQHASDLFNAFSADSDGQNCTYLPYGPFATEKELMDWLIPFSQSEDPWMLAIIDQISGRALGVASYLRITPNAGSVEVGHIHYSNKLKKTKAATEAMYLMAKHVFDLGYRRYEWKCDSLNEGSKRAAERLGFSFEGIFRQATVYRNRNRDTAWFAMINLEWPAIERAYTQWLSPENFDAQGQQQKSLSQLRTGVRD